MPFATNYLKALLYRAHPGKYNGATRYRHARPRPPARLPRAGRRALSQPGLTPTDRRPARRMC